MSDFVKIKVQADGAAQASGDLDKVNRGIDETTAATDRATYALQRRAEALRKYDEAEKRATEQASRKPLPSASPAEEDEVGGLSGRGMKTAAVAAAGLVQMALQYIIAQDEAAEKARQHTEELNKQLNVWRQMSASAKDMNDVAGLASNMYATIDAQRAKLAEVPSSQSMLDGLREGFAAMGFETQETTDAKRQREGEQQLKAFETQQKKVIQQTVAWVDELKQIEALPLPERISELTSKLEEFNAKNADLEVGGRQWVELKPKIDAVTAALEKANRAQEKVDEEVQQRNFNLYRSDKNDKKGPAGNAEREKDAEEVKQLQYALYRSDKNDKAGPAGNDERARKAKREAEEAERDAKKEKDKSDKRAQIEADMAVDEAQTHRRKRGLRAAEENALRVKTQQKFSEAGYEGEQLDSMVNRTVDLERRKKRPGRTFSATDRPGYASDAVAGALGLGGTGLDAAATLPQQSMPGIGHGLTPDDEWRQRFRAGGVGGASPQRAHDDIPSSSGGKGGGADPLSKAAASADKADKSLEKNAEAMSKSLDGMKETADQSFVVIGETFTEMSRKMKAFSTRIEAVKQYVDDIRSE